MGFKVIDIIGVLASDQWAVVARRDGHCQLKHPGKAGRVTIAGPPERYLSRSAAKSVLVHAWTAG